MGSEVHSLSLYQVFNGLFKLYFWLLPDSSALHFNIKDSVIYILEAGTNLLVCSLTLFLFYFLVWFILLIFCNVYRQKFRIYLRLVCFVFNYS